MRCSSIYTISGKFLPLQRNIAHHVCHFQSQMSPRCANVSTLKVSKNWMSFVLFDFAGGFTVCVESKCLRLQLHYTYSGHITSCIKSSTEYTNGVQITLWFIEISQVSGVIINIQHNIANNSQFIKRQYGGWITCSSASIICTSTYVNQSLHK